MSFLSRFSAVQALRQHGDIRRLLAMSMLCFLVVGTVGILKPIRNALALEGLGSAEDFYQVYFISAIVVFFVPLYNKLANRLPWKILIPGVAMFFVSNMLVFRLLYTEGSLIYGMAFYGWYDLFAAALVTQFFIATQIFFNARDAKKAYPLVIMGGSIGATLGSALTRFMAPVIGTPNLLFFAAGTITLFAIGLFVVWSTENPEEGRRRETVRHKEGFSRSEFRRIFSNPHVKLIAAAVLLMVLVKQIVDFEFNVIVGQTFEGLDERASFQGGFFAIVNWLPILVLVTLRPLITRWGVGIAILMLPVAMLAANFTLVFFWALWAASIAKGGDAAFRYAAERTGREILYVPVPDEIKLKAKAYIDIAVEKGVGKMTSAVMLAILTTVIGYRMVPLVGVALCVVWFVVAIAVRREYVMSLRKSIEGRFASLEGVYASIMGASTLPIIRQSLTDPDPLKTAFALDLMDHAGPDDVRMVAPELHALLSSQTPEIRLRALGVLATVPGVVDTEAVRSRLLDADPRVREAAVRTLAATSEDHPERICSELLGMDDSRVRAATLACLATDMSAERAESVVRPFFEERLAGLEEADADQRLELAVAAAVMRTHPDAARLLARLFADPDGQVASAAMRSAGLHENTAFTDPLIDALGNPETRFAAREALTALGQSALSPLIARLNDERADARVRRNIPPVLAGVPSPETVGALIHSYELKETDQLLDNRSLRALTRLRRNEDLAFDEEHVMRLLGREVETAGTYAEALAAVRSLEGGRESTRLLERALREARYDRRESAFRWLALLYPLQGMYRSYLALRSGDTRSRANALEWLESTVGHKVYGQLAPIVERPAEEATATADTRAALRKLWDDEDHWIARCAIWAMSDLRLDGVSDELETWQPEDPEWRIFKTRVLERMRTEETAAEHSVLRKGDMDLIEKVFLLQSVDLLQEAGSAQLALLASIAEEVDSDTNEILIERGDPTDALYVVIRGEVELHGVGDQRLVVEDGSPFGTWALIDNEPSLVEARTAKPTRLLRIGRRDFDDLLADYPELGLDLLQGLARRVRTLVRS